MNNVKIRENAACRGVKLWQIADELGLSDANFSRKLRHELPEDKQQEILRIIDKLAVKREA